MSYEITRLLEFDAGHQLQKHEHLCSNTHGHRYRLELTVSERETLDGVGRVIDFGVLKQIVGTWIGDNLDHSFIAERGDPIINWLQEHKKRLHVVEFPPTAENLSRYLFEWSEALLAPHPVRVVRVRLYETPNCWADWPGTGGVKFDVKATGYVP